MGCAIFISSPSIVRIIEADIRFHCTATRIRQSSRHFQRGVIKPNLKQARNRRAEQARRAREAEESRNMVIPHVRWGIDVT